LLRRRELGIEPIPFNAYLTWKEVASSAEDKLIFFSPYLDEMVLSICEASSLDWSRIQIVTTECEDSSYQTKVKIETIELLMNRGASVHYLPRLHAKALVADWKLAVIGTQNFTIYSQDSYEISFKLNRDSGGANLDEVFETLYEWWEKAVENSQRYEEEFN
jgi:phosphatidylserine/phosphatidylglycerophosphate/cardiolipin synthase-like enzyme